MCCLFDYEVRDPLPPAKWRCERYDDGCGVKLAVTVVAVQPCWTCTSSSRRCNSSSQCGGGDVVLLLHPRSAPITKKTMLNIFTMILLTLFLGSMAMPSLPIDSLIANCGYSSPPTSSSLSPPSYSSPLLGTIIQFAEGAPKSTTAYICMGAMPLFLNSSNSSGGDTTNNTMLRSYHTVIFRSEDGCHLISNNDSFVVLDMGQMTDAAMDSSSSTSAIRVEVDGLYSILSTIVLSFSNMRSSTDAVCSVLTAPSPPSPPLPTTVPLLLSVTNSFLRYINPSPSLAYLINLDGPLPPNSIVTIKNVTFGVISDGTSLSSLSSLPLVITYLLRLSFPVPNIASTIANTCQHNVTISVEGCDVFGSVPQSVIMVGFVQQQQQSAVTTTSSSKSVISGLSLSLTNSQFYPEGQISGLVINLLPVALQVANCTMVVSGNIVRRYLLIHNESYFAVFGSLHHPTNSEASSSSSGVHLLNVVNSTWMLHNNTVEVAALFGAPGGVVAMWIHPVGCTDSCTITFTHNTIQQRPSIGKRDNTMFIGFFLSGFNQSGWAMNAAESGSVLYIEDASFVNFENNVANAGAMAATFFCSIGVVAVRGELQFNNNSFASTNLATVGSLNSPPLFTFFAVYGRLVTRYPCVLTLSHNSLELRQDASSLAPLYCPSIHLFYTDGVPLIGMNAVINIYYNTVSVVDTSGGGNTNNNSAFPCLHYYEDPSSPTTTTTTIVPRPRSSYVVSLVMIRLGCIFNICGLRHFLFSVNVPSPGPFTINVVGNNISIESTLANSSSSSSGDATAVLNITSGVVMIEERYATTVRSSVDSDNIVEDAAMLRNIAIIISSNIVRGTGDIGQYSTFSYYTSFDSTVPISLNSVDLHLSNNSVVLEIDSPSLPVSRIYCAIHINSTANATTIAHSNISVGGGEVIKVRLMKADSFAPSIVSMVVLGTGQLDKNTDDQTITILNTTFSFSDTAVVVEDSGLIRFTVGTYVSGALALIGHPHPGKLHTISNSSVNITSCSVSYLLLYSTEAYQLRANSYMTPLLSSFIIFEIDAIVSNSVVLVTDSNVTSSDVATTSTTNISTANAASISPSVDLVNTRLSSTELRNTTFLSVRSRFSCNYSSWMGMLSGYAMVASFIQMTLGSKLLITNNTVEAYLDYDTSLPSYNGIVQFHTMELIIAAVHRGGTSSSIVAATGSNVVGVAECVVIGSCTIRGTVATFYDGDASSVFILSNTHISFVGIDASVTLIVVSGVQFIVVDMNILITSKNVKSTTDSNFVIFSSILSSAKPPIATSDRGPSDLIIASHVPTPYRSFIRRELIRLQSPFTLIASGVWIMVLAEPESYNINLIFARGMSRAIYTLVNTHVSLHQNTTTTLRDEDEKLYNFDVIAPYNSTVWGLVQVRVVSDILVVDLCDVSFHLDDNSGLPSKSWNFTTYDLVRRGTQIDSGLNGVPPNFDFRFCGSSQTHSNTRTPDSLAYPTTPTSQPTTSTLRPPSITSAISTTRRHVSVSPTTDLPPPSTYYCFNSTYPSTGRNCDILIGAGSCISGGDSEAPLGRTTPTTMPYTQWSTSHPITKITSFTSPVRIHLDSLLSNDTYIHPTTNATLYRIPPSLVVVTQPSTLSSSSVNSVGLSPSTFRSITVAVYANERPTSSATSSSPTSMTTDLVIIVTRKRRSQDRSSAVSGVVGLLANQLDDGILACDLATSSSNVNRYLWLTGEVTFDSPPPLVGTATREASTALTSVATVASAAVGPMAADMQALAALGAMNCAPGGGQAQGQNAESISDSARSLSIFATEGTCKGVVAGNAIALSTLSVLHVVVCIAVFCYKRYQRVSASFGVLDAMAVAKMPSLLFALASALQMGAMVCGYQELMIHNTDIDSDDGTSSSSQSGVSFSAEPHRVPLGIVSFIFAVVVLPVAPLVLLLVLVSRRRYAIMFVSLAIGRIQPKQEDEGPTHQRQHNNSEANIDVMVTHTVAPEGSSSSSSSSLLRRVLMDVFLPTSSIDSDYHPLSTAFSTLVSRNRLPHAIWASLPFLTPLAMLPALIAPTGMCVELMGFAGALHIVLATIVMLFRPNNIFFTNIAGAVALILNGVLIWCAAAIARDPSMIVPRDVMGVVGALQMTLTGVRLLHTGIVSFLFPVLMTLKWMQRPIRIPPPPIGKHANTKIRKGDGAAADDVELTEPLHITSTTTIATPLWTVEAPCAPHWIQQNAGDGTAGDGRVGLIEDLFNVHDLAGPLSATPNHQQPPCRSSPAQPPPSDLVLLSSISLSSSDTNASDDDDDLSENLTPHQTEHVPQQQRGDHHTGGGYAVTRSNSTESRSSSGASMGVIVVGGGGVVERIRTLKDPHINPMALMHSTTRAITALKKHIPSTSSSKSNKLRRKRGTTYRDGVIGFADRQAAMYSFLDEDDDLTEEDEYHDDEVVGGQ